MICFRYIIVITLHRGDNKDDDDDDDDDDNNNNNKVAYVDLCPRASRPVRTDRHIFCVMNLVGSYLAFADGTDMLSRNFGN